MSKEEKRKFYRTRLGGFMTSSKYHMLVVRSKQSDLEDVVAERGREGKEKLRGMGDEELSNQSSLLLLKAKLVGERLKWQKNKFDDEEDQEIRNLQRYGGLKVVKRGDLGRYASCMGERMRNKALHLEYLQDVEEGRTREKTGVRMFAEVLAHIRMEGEKRRREEEEERGEEKEMEGGEYVPEGIAKELHRLKEESVRLREGLGWGRDCGVVDGEVDEELWVPLNHWEAHERVLEESRKLRGEAEETLERKRNVHD